MDRRLVVDVWFLSTTSTCQPKKPMELSHRWNFSGSTLIIINGILGIEVIAKSCYHDFSASLFHIKV
jgi:hypothetical protein